MKKFIALGISVAVVVGLLASGTWAVFTDTETTTGNTFTAGTIDIAVNGDNPGVEGCNIADIKPCQTGWITINVTNEGTNPCELWKHIANVDNIDNEPVAPEQAFYDAWLAEHPNAPQEEGPENWKISDWIHYDMYLCREVAEVIYLVETGLVPGDSGWYYDSSRIYTVELDDVTNRANLSLLTVIPETGDFAGSFDDVAALAVTPDGDSLYVVDGISAELARYDIASDTWTWIGDTGLDGCVQLACALNGDLYASSNGSDELYTVNTSTAATTSFGKIRTGGSAGPIVNVLGADIVFGITEASTEILYLWAPDSLYSLEPQTSPDYVLATLIGGHGDFSYTGLAIRDGGVGDLLGSTTSDDINVIDRTDASKGAVYHMWDADSDTAYDHKWGDMATGPLSGEELIAESDGFYLSHQGPFLPEDNDEDDEVECHYIYLGILDPGEQLTVRQSYHLDIDVDNWGQDDKVTFDIEFVAQQIEGALPEPPGPELPGHGRP